MAAPFWADAFSGAASIVPAANADVSPPDGTWALDLEGWSQWDTCLIGGRIVPGLVKIDGQKGLRVQKKQSMGQHGATPTVLGMDPCELKIRCEMWTRTHLTQFEALVNMLMDGLTRSMKGKSTQTGTTDPRSQIAWPVQHPGLALLRIYSLYFMEFTIPEQASPGVYRATIKMVEFFPRNQGGAQSAARTAKADYNIVNAEVEAAIRQREQPPSKSADPETLGPNEFVPTGSTPE